MNLRKTHIIVFALFVLLLLGCGQDATHAQASLQHIQATLDAGESFPARDQASSRDFDPTLNDTWIGNAVSYGCYRDGQAPGVKGPTKEEIVEDLTIIAAHWNLIRVYNADDDTERILEGIEEQNLPIKMMLGVWLAHEENDPDQKTANITNTLRAIQLANRYPEIVLAINVGNETQVFWSWHKMNSDTLIRYIRAVRANTTQPVTTADDYNFWNKPESKKVAAEVDFIVTHAYPLWNGLTLDTAIPWLNATLQEVTQMHPDKELVLGEIGWATTYNPAKKGDGEQGSLIQGEVSLKAQEQFLRILNHWINEQQITTFFFEVFDEPWKGGGAASGPNEIEKNWGLFYENRTPKQSFQNYLEQPDLTQGAKALEEK
jgi:exo-beta-1,3-glucanase (GH17 family)